MCEPVAKSSLNGRLLAHAGIAENFQENSVENSKEKNFKATKTTTPAECSEIATVTSATNLKMSSETETLEQRERKTDLAVAEKAAAAAAAATQHEPATAAPVCTTTNTQPSQPAAVVPKKSQSDFIFGKCIGEGSFSTVYLAVEKKTRREYAIKVCDKRHILRERKQEYVRREREVLQIMTNVPGFVKLMCTFQDSRSLYFVMTYAPHGELLPHIKRVGCFSVECARHYAAELVLACEQMHRRQVVHRDLKPENILLDREMHTLIADFGSAKLLTAEDIAAAAAYNAELLPAAVSTTTCTTTSSASNASLPARVPPTSPRDDDDDDDSDDLCSEPSADDVADEFYRPQRFRNKRKGSFVGTAQYVSPEVLQNAPISTAADLWALGCILYQMISGLPPFRGYNDFAVFKEILACNIEFPANFDAYAAQLVRELLKINPQARLGAQDDYSQAGYTSIRAHAFFAGIDFATVRERTPPKILPYLPNFDADEYGKSSNHNVARLESELEQVLSLYTASERAQKFELSATEKQRLLALQHTDKWHPFADNEVILKKGLVHKHKGLFASKRMLLLTTGPNLIFVDPAEMIKAGEVPWGAELRVEVGNDKVFFVHTPERTYFFDVLESCAQEWVLAIEKVHSLTYKLDKLVETTRATAHTTSSTLSVE